MQQSVILDHMLAPGVVFGHYPVDVAQEAQPVGQQIEANDGRNTDRYVLQIGGWLQENAKYRRDDEQDTRDVLFDVDCGEIASVSVLSSLESRVNEELSDLHESSVGDPLKLDGVIR